MLRALVRLFRDVAAELLFVVTVWFRLVMLLCKDEPLWFKALVNSLLRLFIVVAEDWLLVVTVWLRLVILL